MITAFAIPSYLKKARFILVMLLLAGQVAAQKQLRFESYAPQVIHWNFISDKGYHKISHYIQKDSFRVEKNNQLFARFSTGAGGELQAYKEYYSNGSLKRADSSGLRMSHVSCYFLCMFENRQLACSKTFFQNGKTESIRYYKSNGSDSLFKEFYANTRIRQQISYCSGDSLVKRWDSTGTLRYNEQAFNSAACAPKRITAWFKTGILSFASFDTLINARPVKCQKEYFGSGVTRSISFFSNNKPCYIWVAFNGNGQLVQSINKGPIPETFALPPPHAEEAPPAEPLHYTTVFPVFGESDASLKNYMDTELAKLSVRHSKLKGSYRVHLYLLSNGSPFVERVEGLNAKDIEQPVKDIVAGMPKWKPAVIRGRPAEVAYLMQLEVK